MESVGKTFFCGREVTVGFFIAEVEDGGLLAELALVFVAVAPVAVYIN